MADIRLALLVCVSTYYVPIALLRQNKPFRSLRLGYAHIIIRFRVCRWSLTNYFASKTQSILRCCFFLAAGNEKSQRANATAISYDANEYRQDDCLKKGWARDSQTRTRLVDSLICIKCSLENNAFFVLYYVINVALHYCMVHRFEIFSAPGTIAHGCIRLPPRSLAFSRGCSLAITSLALEKCKKECNML